MAHPYLDAILREIERDVRQAGMPFISLLGPRVSDKSELLSDVIRSLSARKDLKAQGLLLDLQQLPVVSDAEMRREFLKQLQREAGRAELPLRLDRHVSRIGAFAAAIRDCLAKTNSRLLLCLDHLDCVPRSFGRFLSHQLREIRDQREIYPEYARLGCVIAGTLSLFELRQDEASPYMQGTLLALPLADEAGQCLLVQSRLRSFGLRKCRASVVKRLAELTGGERAFLEPLLQMWREKRGHRPLNLREIDTLIAGDALLTMPVRAFRDLAIRMIIDRKARQLINLMIKGDWQTRVVPSASEIDPLQLDGIALRLDDGPRSCYRLRNRLLAAFVESALPLLEIDGWHGAMDSQLLRDVAKLRELHFRLIQAGDLESAARTLTDAWPLLTDHSEARIYFLAKDRSSVGAWCFEYADGDLESVELNHIRTRSPKWLAEYVGNDSNGSKWDSSARFVIADSSFLYAVYQTLFRQFEITVIVAMPQGARRGGFSEVVLAHWFNFIDSAQDRVALLLSQEILRVLLTNKKPGLQRPNDRKNVFVVHGRNLKIRDSMFAFLRAIGLKPLEWKKVVLSINKGTPTIAEIVDQGFAMAHSAVILFTGDDEARLQERLWGDEEPDIEKHVMPQARANVLYEAGMAMGRYPERTIMVKIGRQKLSTDISGLHTIDLNNSEPKRLFLAELLTRVGCAADLRGTKWHTAGDFTNSAPRAGRPAQRERVSKDRKARRGHRRQD